MLASSKAPLKNSELPCVPIRIGAVLLIEPMFTDFEYVWPSTISLIDDDVLTHWTVCHLPLFSAGPLVSEALVLPLKPHDACPEGWYSIFHSPPGVSALPLRIRSQSGVLGTLVALRWIVTVMSLLPAFRSLADGTET